eukprot:m.196991 g.196991  ORF g.196991 m.196991 type:complete len:642 (+) comp10088_c0_seq15:2783-4708(+)
MASGKNQAKIEAFFRKETLFTTTIGSKKRPASSPNEKPAAKALSRGKRAGSASAGGPAAAKSSAGAEVSHARRLFKGAGAETDDVMVVATHSAPARTEAQLAACERLASAGVAVSADGGSALIPSAEEVVSVGGPSTSWPTSSVPTPLVAGTPSSPGALSSAPAHADPNGMIGLPASPPSCPASLDEADIDAIFAAAAAVSLPPPPRRGAPAHSRASQAADHAPMAVDAPALADASMDTAVATGLPSSPPSIAADSPRPDRSPAATAACPPAMAATPVRPGPAVSTLSPMTEADLAFERTLGSFDLEAAIAQANDVTTAPVARPPAPPTSGPVPPDAARALPSLSRAGSMLASLVGSMGVDDQLGHEQLEDPYGRYRRLVVISVSRSRYQGQGREMNQRDLLAVDEKRGAPETVHLRGDWAYSAIRAGDIINVFGTPDAEGVVIVDNDQGLLVVHPDTLISSTRVIDAMTCERRSVLSERVDLPMDRLSPAMLFGSILHRLFQKAAAVGDYSSEFLRSLKRLIVKEHLEELYSAGITDAAVEAEMDKYIPVLQHWSKFTRVPRDVAFDVPNGPSENVSMQLERVLDIEENLWSPRFGLKGKVDLSFEVKIHRTNRRRTLARASSPLSSKPASRARLPTALR